MLVESLQGHLAVCSQRDLPSWGKMDPGFWNVISIREPANPRIDESCFLKVHTSIFDDVVGLGGIKPGQSVTLPQSRHLKGMFEFADSISGQPLLIHCWAGVSRSTAVALSLLVRALWGKDLIENEIVTTTVETLLKIRPQASPNPLVLQLGLEQFMESDCASAMVKMLVNSPGLFANRFQGAEPGG